MDRRLCILADINDAFNGELPSTPQTCEAAVYTGEWPWGVGMLLVSLIYGAYVNL